MKYGRLNIMAGGAVIIICGIGGFVLGFTLDPLYESGFYKVTYGRGLLKAGHTHGMPVALYNIILGLGIDRLLLDDKWKKRLSVLTLMSFIMPIGLILRGLTGGAMTFAPVVLVGAVSFMASAAILVKSGLSAKE